MTPELKTKWIEALRSGKYEQGKHYLKVNGKFCCLGVLCEVMEVPSMFDDKIGQAFYIFENIDYILSRDENKFARMNAMIPMNATANIGLPYDLMLHLMELNDKGLTFDEIATVIEDQL